MSARPAATPPRLEALTQRLLTILRHEVQLYDELLDLTTAERTAITSPMPLDFADGPLPLERIVAAKEDIVARLNELEAGRVRLSGTLAAVLGLPRDARLTTILPHLASPVAAALQAERATLLARAQALAEANEANADLLHSVLGTTRATIGYIRTLQGNGYHNDGRADVPPLFSRRLDRQA